MPLQPLGVHYSSAFYSTLLSFFVLKIFGFNWTSLFIRHFGSISRFERFVQSWNRSPRKSLIFKNIPQPKKWESWDESKDILIKEIRSVMPTVQETVIQDKTERMHRSRENNYNKNLAIIVKFNGWQFTESIKTSFIRGKLQIYFPRCTH